MVLGFIGRITDVTPFPVRIAPSPCRAQQRRCCRPGPLPIRPVVAGRVRPRWGALKLFGVGYRRPRACPGPARRARMNRRSLPGRAPCLHLLHDPCPLRGNVRHGVGCCDSSRGWRDQHQGVPLMSRRLTQILAGLWRSSVPHSRPQANRVRLTLEELEVRCVLSTSASALPPLAQQMLGDIQARLNVVRSELGGGNIGRTALNGGLGDVRANLQTAMHDLQVVKSELQAAGLNPKPLRTDLKKIQAGLKGLRADLRGGMVGWRADFKKAHAGLTHIQTQFPPGTPNLSSPVSTGADDDDQGDEDHDEDGNAALQADLKAFQDDLKTLQDDLNASTLDPQALQNDLKALQDDLQAIQNDINAGTGTMTGDDDHDDGDEEGGGDNPQAVQADLKALQDDLTKLQTDLQANPLDPQALQTDLKALQADFKSLQTDLGATEDDNDEHEGEGMLRSDLQTFQNDLKTLQDDLNAATLDPQALQADLKTLQADLKVLQNDLGAGEHSLAGDDDGDHDDEGHGGQQAALQADLKALQDDLTKLQTDLQANPLDSQALQNDLKALQDHFQALQTDLQAHEGHQNEQEG